MHPLFLITVWLGTWKGWINIHLGTCAANPTVQWIFLHDQDELPEFRPENVRFTRVTLSDLRARFVTACGRDVSLTVPYKVCDIRPALGAMFPEWIPQDSPWGYCDSDLLWGNIRSFVSDEDLITYDVISSHICSVIGQCTIFRSSRLARSLLLEVENLEMLLLEKDYSGIDELKLDRVVTEWEEAGRLKASRRMLQVWERLYVPSWEDWASTRESKRLRRQVVVKFPVGPCEWSDGKLCHLESGREFMFFHFVEWKRSMNYPRLRWVMGELSAITVNSTGMRFSFRGGPVSRSMRCIALWLQITFYHWCIQPCWIWQGRASRAWVKLRAKKLPNVVRC